MKKLFIVILLVISSAVYSQYELQWYATYDNPHPSYNDDAVDIVEDNSGNIYVTGTSFQMDPTDDWRYDFATVKYNSSGDSLWVRRFDTSILNENEDRAVAIGIDALNNVYVTGTSYTSSHVEATTIKYNSDGNEIWKRSYFDSTLTILLEVKDMKVDIEGNVFVALAYYGISRISEIIKYNTNGEMVWIRKYFNGNSDINNIISLTLDNSGNIYATGCTRDSGTSGRDYLTLKYSPDGILLWAAKTNQSEEDIGYSVKADDNGNTYVAGYSRVDESNHDFKLIKYNSSGEMQWIRSYTGRHEADGFHMYGKRNMIVLDDDGNIYANFSTRRVSYLNDIATIKYDPFGALKWINIYSHIPGMYASQQEAEDIKIVRSDIYIIGKSTFDETSDSYVILKYDTSGITKNIIRNENQFINIFLPVSLAVNENGKISATGSCISGYNHYVTDYFTVQYSNTTGLNTLSNSIPDKFRLDQNYPNPFNPATSITYSLGEPGLVSLKIFDILGKEISSLVNEKQNAGSHVVEFKGEGLPSGIYFYSLESGKFSATKRMILLK